MPNEIIKQQYNRFSSQRGKWLKKNWYYYKVKEKIYRFMVPESKRVLVIGCENGDFLASLKPSYGIGVDISDKMINIARQRHPEYKFHCMDAQEQLPDEKFDYVIAFGMLGELNDVQKFFDNLKSAGDEFTRYIIDYYNSLWEPLLKLGEIIRCKMPISRQNWLQTGQINCLLDLSGFEVIKMRRQLLFPFYIPFLSFFINSIVINFPFVNRLSLMRLIITKKKSRETKKYGVSVIIPCRNEEGNVMEVVKKMPEMGTHTEIIFVDNGSTDRTADEINKAIGEYPQKDIKLYSQPKAGKKNAVIEGFDRAEQEVLMILDADLSTGPEDLVKFFNVVAEGKAEFVNGTRMVYPQQKEAMRYLNMLGNYLFGRIFSLILDFPLTDTLCGSKAILKRYWPDIKKSEIIGRKSLDQWGDFDLLFGAAFWNLKMVELPIRYKPRRCGLSKMKRFRNGSQLLLMSFSSFKRFKILV